jgi:hypothetical protein
MMRIVRLLSMRGLLLAPAVALLCAGFWMNAYAEEKRLCAEEIARFCKDVKPGEGRLVQCLKEHEKELSAECGEKFTELKKIYEEAQQACAEDVKKFCKDIQPGGGRIAQCLEGHAGELSPACREKLTAAVGTKQKKK